MRLFYPLLLSFAFVGLTTVYSPAQQPNGELPEEARKRLEHAIGKWEVTTKFYNADGEVIRENKGIDTNRYVIPGRLIEHNIANSEGVTTARGQMFYNVREEKFCVTSVDANGDLWILTGGLDTFVLTSRPREQPNGTVMMVRFTHENIEEDSFEAQMEISRDGGETWRKGYRQFIKRLEEGDDATEVGVDLSR